MSAETASSTLATGPGFWMLLEKGKWRVVLVGEAWGNVTEPLFTADGKQHPTATATSYKQLPGEKSVFIEELPCIARENKISNNYRLDRDEDDAKGLLWQRVVPK